MSRFFGAGEPERAALLDYEGTLNALLSLVGPRVIVLFSGASGSPFVFGVQSGRLDRGEVPSACRACCSAPTRA